MRRTLCGVLIRTKRQVVRDLREDPYLPFILLLSILLAGFWFWHRIPGFATRDERDRVFDVLVWYGTFVSDPGVDSFRTGIEWSRVPFGATFYLYAVVLFPVVLVALVVGAFDGISAVAASNAPFGFWPVWRATPEWIWTLGLSLVRLTSVALAVGSVYLTYRIGTVARDRLAGRLAATVLTVTFGFLTLAHEGGEDMPALFFILLSIYLAFRYVETGDDLSFLGGSASGGVALSFKLTAAPIVLLLGVSYLLRLRTADDWRAALAQPGLLVTGGIVGAVTIVLGFPTVLVSGFEPLAGRLLHGATVGTKRWHGPDAPIWWWYLRNYLNGLGLSLFVASAVGVGGSLVRLRERSIEASGVVLCVTGVGAYLLLFSSWHNLRVHHLLPTFPMLALLLGISLSRLSDRSPRIARPIIVVLLVTSATYASMGVFGYATQPRDEATAWLEQNTDENATMEIYRTDMQDAAVPHGMEIIHPNARGQEGDDNAESVCPEYIQLGYRDLYYLNPDTFARNDPVVRSYFRGLLDGRYNYEVVAEFGTRPDNYVARPSAPHSVRDALRIGIVPRIAQYGDEQELGPDQYTVILRRTGPCELPRTHPFA